MLNVTLKLTTKICVKVLWLRQGASVFFDFFKAENLRNKVKKLFSFNQVKNKFGGLKK